MELYKNVRIVLACCTLLVFTSCIKYHKLLKSEFPQGSRKEDRRDVAYNFLRTTKVYEEFNTLAIFHTLWLSDEVRTAYVDDFCLRRGKDNESREALLKRQLEENRHWISFYVQADIRNRLHVALNDKNSFWTLYLQTADGKQVEPLSIKVIDVEPEYQRYLGHRYNPFKEAYLVRFPMQGIDSTKYLQEGRPFKLIISSPFKKVDVEWDEKNCKKHAELLKDEDFYWG